MCFSRVDDDIRQSEGFKNVSLGNVLAVAYATKKEKLTFLREEDKVTQAASFIHGFIFQVVVCELLRKNVLSPHILVYLSILSERPAFVSSCISMT